MFVKERESQKKKPDGEYGSSDLRCLESSIKLKQIDNFVRNVCFLYLSPGSVLIQGVFSKNKTNALK